VTTADAVTREAAWLNSYNDGLPALHTSQNGPFDVVQAYWPRTRNARKGGIYVMRGEVNDRRFAAHRKIARHAFRLMIEWPIGGTTVATHIWEDEQQALDSAVDLLLQRIRGLDLDHTHGGRFLSVAEAPEPGSITVRFDPPERMPTNGRAVLTASATYLADDELIG
jgi:hypothetical protein